jgi:hypothetical protein
MVKIMKNENVGILRQKVFDLAQEMHALSGNEQTPQGRALLETSAEVLDGVHKAFEHYLAKSEDAWKR